MNRIREINRQVDRGWATACDWLIRYLDPEIQHRREAAGDLKVTIVLAVAIFVATRVLNDPAWSYIGGGVTVFLLVARTGSRLARSRGELKVYKEWEAAEERKYKELLDELARAEEWTV